MPKKDLSTTLPKFPESFVKDLELLGIDASFMEIKLPEQGRLSYIEELVRKGEIGLMQAMLISWKSPVLMEEMQEIAEDSKKELYCNYNIKIPDYALEFGYKWDEIGPCAGGGADWLRKKIYLRPEGHISSPIDISHEQGHAYHMENSRLWGELKGVYDENNIGPYKKLRREALNIIDGWAGFVSNLYVQIRDKRLGEKPFYATLLSGQTRIIGDLNVPAIKRYSKGLVTFEDIFKRRGLEGAIYAAANFLTDTELRAF